MTQRHESYCPISGRQCGCAENGDGVCEDAWPPTIEKLLMRQGQDELYYRQLLDQLERACAKGGGWATTVAVALERHEDRMFDTTLSVSKRLVGARWRGLVRSYRHTPTSRVEWQVNR